MPAKKVLLISARPASSLEIGVVGSPAVEVSTVPRLDLAVQRMRTTQFDAVLFTQAAEDSHLALFKSELARIAAPPAVVCLAHEQTDALREDLEFQEVAYRAIPQLTQAALLAALAEPDPLTEPRAGIRPQPPAENWERALVGESPAMERLRETIRLVAPRSCTILITGESGTGKEVVARALHLASNRAARPMVSVNCAAVPGALLESEMFGHTKGAFTGAISNRLGRFEQAHQSTIFLDEIGDTPIELQPKILRVLQEREIQKVGSSANAKVDVRVVAATNRDLNHEMEAGRFRQDLYFRLRVIPLHIPPLRERPADVPALVNHFLEKICRREGIARKSVEPGVVSHLSEQPWPGNVRELGHSIERAIALSGDREVLDLWDFPPFCDVVPLRPCATPAAASANGNIDLEQTVAKLERALIGYALQRSRGNKARAAQMLGLKRSTLVSKVRAFHICA